MGNPDDNITVQVCYVKLDRYVLKNLQVLEGTTLYQAIIQSGILSIFPEIDLAKCQVGIFGQLRTPDTVLRQHDRVEIYRPLLVDPKEMRRRRAAKKSKATAD